MSTQSLHTDATTVLAQAQVLRAQAVKTVFRSLAHFLSALFASGHGRSTKTKALGTA